MLTQIFKMAAKKVADWVTKIVFKTVKDNKTK